LGMLTATSFAQMRFGGEVGLNISNVNISPSTGTTLKSAMGARIGAIADFSITDAISIQPGVMFSMLGYKDDAGTNSLNYIQIPININYKFEVGPGKLFLGLTPYFGYAMSGKNSDGSSVTFGSNPTDIKAIDFGVGVNAGYELPMGLLFRAGYDYGMGNLTNISGATINNTNIHISVGYLFGGSN